MPKQLIIIYVKGRRKSRHILKLSEFRRFYDGRFQVTFPLQKRKCKKIPFHAVEEIFNRMNKIYMIMVDGECSSEKSVEI